MFIFLSLLAPFLVAITILFDSHLINNIFKRNSTFLAFISIFDLILLIFLYLIFSPNLLISISLLIPIIITGFLEFFYLIPYAKALENDDSANVSSLFILGKIFIPILSFYLVGELLTISQYIGFFIIIISAFFITFNKNESDGKFKINKSFFLMLLSSIIFAISNVLYKYIFTQTDFITGFFLVNLVSSLFLFSLFLLPKIRKDAYNNINNFFKNSKYMFLNEFIGFSGFFVANYAISVGSVSVVKGLASIQPFYILILTILFHKFKPNVFKEDISLNAIKKKSFLFLLMFIGTILIIYK